MLHQNALRKKRAKIIEANLSFLSSLLADQRIHVREPPTTLAPAPKTLKLVSVLIIRVKGKIELAVGRGGSEDFNYTQS